MTFIKGMRPANLRQWTPEEDALMLTAGGGEVVHAPT